MPKNITSIPRRKTISMNNNKSSKGEKKGANECPVVSYITISHKPKKNKTVLQRENKMKFLRGCFPYTESMVLHDVLSKHKFNMDLATQELIEMISPWEQHVALQVYTNKADMSCPICFDSLSDKDIFATVCWHTFCKSCITTALAIQKVCPVCRHPLKLKTIRRM